MFNQRKFVSINLKCQSENCKKVFSAPFIQICSQSDPKLSACIRKSILALRPHLSQGIPEINVPSLDPLLVPEFSIAQESGINVQASFKNITIDGATNFRLRSVRTDTQSDKFRMKIWFPELIMKGEYDIQGMMLMMPIRGNGMAYGNFSEHSSRSYHGLAIKIYYHSFLFQLISTASFQ